MFDFLKKKKEEKAPVNEGVLYPVAEGRLMNIEQVPDEVFSKKMMGDGYAVDPSANTFYSPCDGKISLIPETLHAVGITADTGAEVLIHIGMDTVNLKGEGFTAKVKEGDTVKAGDPLVEADLDAIRDKVPSLVTPVIITNIDEYDIVSLDLEGDRSTPCIQYKRK